MYPHADPMGGLPVAGRPVTVFGGRGPALSSIAQLQTSGADVTVVAATADATVSDLAQRSLVTWCRRDYRPTDLERPWLVVAATGNPVTDKQIEADAESRRLWCLRPHAGSDGGHRPTPGSCRVTLVGGGPGDPGLMTLTGLEALRSADVVVVDRLAPLALLDHAPQHAEIVDAGKAPHGRAMAQAEINTVLVERALAGHHVVRLKGGDAFLFGRGGEEVLACAEAGVDVHVVPGVSSALAAPAAAGIPVTHRGLSQGLTVVSGHAPPGDPRSTVDYEALARSGTTLVFLMAIENLPHITHALIAAGMPPTTPAATIADATTDRQQVLRGSLAGIAADAATAGVRPPAVTVVGSVAALDPHPLRVGSVEHC